MKKIWSAPEAIAEQFAANEYVAACYIVNCDVPSGYKLYNESNGEAGLQTSGDKPDELLWETFILQAGGCNNWHPGVIRDEDPEKNGYWIDWLGNTVEVFWWYAAYGDGSANYHASKSLQFETNPNAS